jgi:dCTP deaminase
MSVKSDSWIKKMALEKGMIEPFEDGLKREGVISYGLSSYGYDMRVGNRFKVISNGHGAVSDPKKFDSASFTDATTDDHIVIPPNSVALAQSVEYFRIPRNVVTICFGKSTYARCGLIVNVTPFEPEWEGFVTMELSNTSPLPVKVYANEGIAQVLFLESDEVCRVSYADRKGKYQKQTAITLPKI